MMRQKSIEDLLAWNVQEFKETVEDKNEYNGKTDQLWYRKGCIHALRVVLGKKV